MSIRILYKKLAGSVRPHLHGHEMRTLAREFCLPCAGIINHKGEMVPPASRLGCMTTGTDDVQFLSRPQAEPMPGKIEVRAGKRFQLQHATVEIHRPRHIPHLNGHMVQFCNSHAKVLPDPLDIVHSLT